MRTPPDAKRPPLARAAASKNLGQRIADDTIVTEAHKHPRYDCRIEVDRLRRQLHLLAEHLGVDLGWLEVLNGPDVAAGTPASFEACLAIGIDPLDGHDLHHHDLEERGDDPDLEERDVRDGQVAA